MAQKPSNILKKSLSELHIRHLRSDRGARPTFSKTLNWLELIACFMLATAAVWTADTTISWLVVDDWMFLEDTAFAVPFTVMITRLMASAAFTAAIAMWYRNWKVAATVDLELKRSSRWFSTTLKSVNAALIAVDRDHTVMYMNPMAETLTKWPAARAIGEPIRNVCPLLDAGTRAETLDVELLEAVVGAGSVARLDGDIIVQAADGAEPHVIGTAAPIKEDNEILGAVVVLQDVTELKKAEEQIALLAAVVTEADEIVFICDPTGRIEYISPSFTRATGLKADSLMGASVDSFLSGKVDETYSKRLDIILDAGEARRYRYALTRDDGTRLHFDCRLSNMLDEDGEVRKRIYVSRDITGEIKLQRHLDQSQKMEALGRMASSVAHDVNNMLNAIGLCNSLTVKSASEPEQVLATAKQMSKIIAKSGDLVRQLLSFSRSRKFEPVIVNVNKRIRDDEPMLRHMIKKSVELTLTLSANRLVRVDPGQFSQSIMNLLINASDAISEAGEISIATEDVTVDRTLGHLGWELAPGAYVRISVADNGPGIDEDTRARMFEPFFTTKEDGRGTGLGLAIVYGFIKQIGGDIHVESVVGEGTRFNLYIPAGAGANDSSAADKTPCDPSRNG